MGKHAGDWSWDDYSRNPNAPLLVVFSLPGNYRLDTWMALFGLVVIGTIFAYTAFLKGTSLVGAVKGSLLASFEPVSAVFFAFVIMKEHFFMVDVIGMAMILPYSSLDFPQGFHDSKKEKASCKTKTNHILVKRLRRRSWPFCNPRPLRESYHYIAYTSLEKRC